ncbi:hypothetical protein LIA77_08369 [Sarocladium implicatum]|nr:hypothetical protein LIA77_08369 [Sarocladium implicatum]
MSCHLALAAVMMSRNWKQKSSDYSWACLCLSAQLLFVDRAIPCRGRSGGSAVFHPLPRCHALPLFPSTTRSITSILTTTTKSITLDCPSLSLFGCRSDCHPPATSLAPTPVFSQRQAFCLPAHPPPAGGSWSRRPRCPHPPTLLNPRPPTSNQDRS